MNRLPPSLREDHRYLKFRIHAEGDIDIGDFVDTLWNKALDYLGTRGSSQADFWILGNKFDEVKQEGVIKVRKNKLEDFRAALCLINEFNGVEGFMEVTDVSGSIKGLEE